MLINSFVGENDFKQYQARTASHLAWLQNEKTLGNCYRRFVSVLMDKDKVTLVLISGAPCHEDVWGCGGTDTHVNLGTRCWSVASFTPVLIQQGAVGAPGTEAEEKETLSTSTRNQDPITRTSSPYSV